MSYVGNTPTTQSFIAGTDYFNGTGSQTAFTLSRNVVSANDIQATVNNVVQQPNDAYTVSGTTITFTSAPSAGTNNIYVRYLSTTTQSITPSQNTVSYSTLNTDMQSGGYASNFKNRIINGAMVISQRNGTSSVAVTDSTYILDRWQTYVSQTGKLSAQQDAGAVTPPVGFTDYLGYTSLSAYSVGASEQFIANQPIEGFNIADFGWGTASASTVTLSFWVRSSLTGTHSGALRNGAGNRSYVYTFTVNSANTWEYKTITIVGDTSGTWTTTNGYGTAVQFNLGSGSSASTTAGVWTAGNFAGATGAVSVVGTNGATFYITGVQLEKGSTATSFDYRPYGTELQLCQRYFQTIKSGLAVSCESTINTILLSSVSYPIQMRATPTVSQSGVFSYEVPYGSSSTQSSASTTLEAGASSNVGASVQFNNFTGLTYARTYRTQIYPASFLLFSAEL
jgi:hypothetical protein